jgi:hypothetical protein
MSKAAAVGALSLLIGTGALADGLHEAHILPGFTSPGSPGEPISTSGPRFSLQVPAFSSLPSAAAKLYLDFDGDVTPTWQDYSPGTTPAYDLDSDPTTFFDAELFRIQEIWTRVSEMYSPFNIDVTTVNPGNLNNNQTMRIVIGGDGKNGAATPWYGTGTVAGGIAYIGGFANSFPNTGFVFPGNLDEGNAKYVAIAAAHEAGHGFGLGHQSLYNGFNKTTEYNPGTGEKAPIMGVAYQSQRALWYPGWDFGTAALPNDLEVIGSNLFGYREDDHGDEIAAATPLSIVGGSLAANGVISSIFEPDYFTFSLDEESLVNLMLRGAPIGGMLDPTLWLFAADGSSIQRVATPSLTEVLSRTLLPGTYGIGVFSAGRYGDVGQFRLTGTITAVPEPALSAAILLSALFLSRARRV